MDGDFFIGAALATTLTKLSLHFSETVLKADPKGQTKVNYLTNLIFQLFSISRKKIFLFILHFYRSTDLLENLC